MATEKYYEIKSEGHTFHAVVLSKEYGHHNIKFGGKKSCVLFSIYDEERKPNLDRLQYDSECAVNVNVLEQGGGTLIMAKAAMQFMYELFPKQKDMKFMDWSEIECDKEKIVPLAYYYIVKYGKTWYEAKFNARPNDAIISERIAEFNRVLDEPIKKVLWKEFVDMYITPCEFPKHTSMVEFLKAFYDADGVDTFRAFFRKVMDKYDCLVLTEWMERFAVLHLQLPLPFKMYKWTIKKKDISKMNIKVDVLLMDKKPRFPTFMSGGRLKKGRIVPEGIF
jgi:hypothetical protein